MCGLYSFVSHVIYQIRSNRGDHFIRDFYNLYFSFCYRLRHSEDDPLQFAAHFGETPMQFLANSYKRDDLTEFDLTLGQHNVITTDSFINDYIQGEYMFNE